MSRRHKIAAARARSSQLSALNSQPGGGTAADTIPTISAEQLFAGGGFGWGAGNGHQGADTSRNRAMVYFPELDTRREITSYTRTELMRKSRFLYANYGIAKRIVNGLARMVAGTGLTPQAATADKAWNAEAEKYFAQQTDSQFAFDVGGRYNFPKSQQGVLRFGYRDGDNAALLSESLAGNARYAFYEGNQIGSDLLGSDTSTTPPGATWRDGVLLDRNNRALKYRILGDEGRYQDVDAQDLIFFCNYERAGQARGITVLSHAINHLLDAAEITGYIKTGVKLANQYGYWVEYEAAANKPSSTPGSRVAGARTVKVDTPAGPVNIAQIYGGGQIPDLPPGAKLKFNGSSHPHPNNLTLIDYLIRDIAWGVGLSPEILWNIAALGGANTRFVLADAQAWIEEQQAELVRLYNSRVWIYTLAKGMKNGKLRRCPDPEWWKHVWIPPPRLTVDFGKDGKLHLEQLKMGVITYSQVLGWQGRDYEHHVNQYLDELAIFKAGLNADNAKKYKPGADRNLTWDDIQQWRNSVGFRPNVDPSADATLEDGMSANPSNAQAQLAEMLRKPGAAEKFMAHLQSLPEAA